MSVLDATSDDVTAADVSTAEVAVPDVSVVVPYYRDQQGLDRLLSALELQTIGPGRLEVVVADDGSPEAPVGGDRPFPAWVVRQDDRGFRAAAARNLGAGAARGRVLAFLDGDMIPEPGDVAAVLGGLADPAGLGGERTLVVGRRRHAYLGGWGVAAIRAWLAGTGPAPEALGDPQWLADGYAATRDLRDADDRSYRFVISAVLAVPRERFLAVGGAPNSPGTAGRTGSSRTAGVTRAAGSATSRTPLRGRTAPTSGCGRTRSGAGRSRTARRCGSHLCCPCRAPVTPG